MARSDEIRVFILHGDPIVRAGLLATFATQLDIKVVGLLEDFNQSDLVSAYAPHMPDIVIADHDVAMNLASTQRHPYAPGNPRIIVVAAVDREWQIRTAIEKGVRGYMLLGCPIDSLTTGVRAVHRGQRYMSEAVAQRLAESLSGDPLTVREEDVLRLVVAGFGNKAIGRHLNIAVGTVKSHLKAIFDKLDVYSRTQAIRAAERRGLLRSSEVPPKVGSEAAEQPASAGALPQFEPGLARSTLRQTLRQSR